MGESFEGTIWRHLPAEDPRTKQPAHPLNFGRILSANGRWNVQGKFGCLYTSLTPRGALYEYRKACLRNPSFRNSHRVLVSINVEVEPVLDLREGEVRRKVQLSKETIQGDDPEDVEKCKRTAAEAIYDHAAIVAPSAAVPPSVDDEPANLMIYESSPGQTLELEVGGDRRTIEGNLLDEYNVEMDV